MKDISKFYPRAIIIGLVASATLMQQIMFTRLFSVQLFYHFAFAAISLTMLGMTMGAIRVFVRYRNLDAKSAEVFLQKQIFNYFLSSLIVTILVAMQVFLIGVTHFIILLILTVIFIVYGFAASGSVITILLTRYRPMAAKLYAADLLGAGIGCWLTLLLLDYSGLINGLLFTTLSSLIALYVHKSHTISKNKKPKFYGLIAFLVIFFASCATYIYMPKVFYLDSIGLKNSGWWSGIEYEKWNSYSRIIVSTTSDIFPGDDTLSKYVDIPGKKYPHKTLIIDSSASTKLTQFDNDLNKISYLKNDITSSPYALRHAGKVAVIGVGGGRDILIALLNNASQILGIEVNNTTYTLITSTYADYVGHLNENPKVKIINDEARGYLARLDQPVDLIQISLVDTWAAAASGAFGLTENGLYTSNAWQIFYDKLSPTGVLSLTRWYSEQRPGELYRMLAMANNLMKQNNITDPLNHVVVVSNNKNLATMLFSKSAISAREASNIKTFAKNNGFEILSINGYTQNEDIKQLITEGKLSKAASEFDLTPPNDNRPFFFNMLRPHQAIEWILGQSDYKGLNNFGIELLIILIIMLSAISVYILFIPLRRMGLPVKAKVLWRPALYFSMIGFGFMLVEIPLTLYFGLYLGRPALGLVVTLFGILTMSGIGSYLSSRKFLSPHFKLLCLALSVLIGSLLLPQIIANTYTLTEHLRIIISLVFIALIGLWMGMAFPIGISTTEGKNKEMLLPWLWAINGGASVIGTVLALLVAIFYGLSQAMQLGFCCYAIVWAIYPSLVRKLGK